MAALAKGSRPAFETLYDRYFAKLVWYARGFVLDTQKAEDVVQEVFMRIIDRPEAFSTERKFSTWIYTVTGNSCRNILRNEQNRERVLRDHIAPLEPKTTTLRSPDQKKLQVSIKKVLEGLSEKERNIYSLRFEHELSIREISDIAGIPEGSVKSGIFYLLKKLAVQLKDFSYEQ